MEINKRLAQKAQLSADKMEKMTEQMRHIAKKTEKETISMRIVTLVTLFFLPGTFISVCLIVLVLKRALSDQQLE
jgi:hypothetical protein